MNLRMEIKNTDFQNGIGVRLVIISNIMKNSESIKVRAKVFGEALIPFLSEYGKQTIREFFDYWTEHNANGKKMRFEMEKIFDVKRRLVTWNRNNQKWDFKRLNDHAEAITQKIIPQEIEHIGTSRPGSLH
jgi:hypothetical protein